MKGGRTPIHIQRWAPADYHHDEHVRLLKARRDYRTLTFYRNFLDHSFLAGGDLPADPEALAAVVEMPRKDVEAALSFCLGRLIHQNGERLYQGRVVREVADEMAFREEQGERGRRGGRPKTKATDNPPLSGAESEGKARLAPSASTSTSAGASADASAKEPGGREPASEAQRREVLALLAEGAESPWGEGLDGEQLLAAASATSSGSCITNIYGPRVSAAWVEATRQKLIQRRAIYGSRASPAPSERARARDDAARAMVIGGLRGDGTVEVGHDGRSMVAGDGRAGLGPGSTGRIEGEVGRSRPALPEAPGRPER